MFNLIRFLFDLVRATQLSFFSHEEPGRAQRATRTTAWASCRMPEETAVAGNVFHEYSMQSSKAIALGGAILERQRRKGSVWKYLLRRW